MATPLILTPLELAQRSAALAKRADAAWPGSNERADLLDEIGRLWADQGYTEIGQSWHDAATYCRTYRR